MAVSLEPLAPWVARAPPVPVSSLFVLFVFAVEVLCLVFVSASLALLGVVVLSVYLLWACGHANLYIVFAKYPVWLTFAFFGVCRPDQRAALP